MRAFRVRFIAVLMMVGVVLASTGQPAGAAEITFGGSTTMDELLASPEYLPEHSDIARLYQSFFSRVPDVPGLVYWINQYEAGVDYTALIGEFEASVEFQSMFGSSLSDEEFLTVVYRNILERGYDQAGFDYWLSQMQAGLTRAQTVFYVGQSDEFKRNYPYAPSAPDYTAAMLAQSDLPSLFTDYAAPQRLTGTAAEFDENDQCGQIRQLHFNAVELYAGDSTGGAFVLQHQYAFTTAEQAEAYMASFAQLPSLCPYRTFEFDDGAVLTIRYESGQQEIVNSADMAWAVNASWTWHDGTRYSYVLVATRNGSVITITDYTTRSYNFYLAQTLSYATTTSDRLAAMMN